MTAKKDFKRRVRERQRETGESYVTALRRVLAKRPARGAPAIGVVDFVDATAAGATRGLTCRLSVEPELARRVGIDRLIEALARALHVAQDDPAFALMRAVALHGERPRVTPTIRLADAAFLRRAVAGIGGVSERGNWLALAIDGQMVLFALSLTPSFVDFVREPLLVAYDLASASVDLSWLASRVP